MGKPTRAPVANVFSGKGGRARKQVARRNRQPLGGGGLRGVAKKEGSNRDLERTARSAQVRRGR